MTENIVDEVVALTNSEKFEGNKSVSGYVKALESLDLLKKKGVVKDKGNNLLPIEERYKSVYSTNESFH